MSLRGGLTLVAVLALAACGGARSPAPPQPQTAATPPPARTVAPVARPASPAAQPAVPKPVLADLLGRSATQIDGLLGAPDLVRTEGAGEVRIYRNAACVLHVFVYPRGGTRQATHAEARTTAGRLDGTQADECLAGLVS